MKTRVFDPKSNPVDSATEVAFVCPECGSPYIATFETADPRAKAIQNFSCGAGDCKYAGPAERT